LPAAFGPADAAEGVGIAPVRVDIDDRHRVQTIVISNHDPFNHVFQFTAFRWTQSVSRDVETPTDELIVSPPIFTLLPDAQQVVRIALRAPAPVAAELTYRLLLRAAGSGAAAPPATGISVQLQYSIPVFIASPQANVVKLDWSYRNAAAGALEIDVTNSGTEHARIDHLTLSDDRGVIYNDTLARYVLAGATAAITVHPAHATSAATLNARIQFDSGSPQQVVVRHAP
jgi:fimbrial chaperone protein